MTLVNLIRIANNLDLNGYSELANELDSIINKIAHEEISPEDMTDEEVENRAEDLVMLLAQQLNEAGYNIPAQKLFEIMERVGFDPVAIVKEIEKLSGDK